MNEYPVGSTSGVRLGRWLLRQRRVATARLLAWTLVQALPALFSGRLVAAAVDEGFLAGRPVVGWGYLAVLGAGMACSALAARQVFGWIAEIVEPLRDQLLRNVVTGALASTTTPANRVDAASVARLTDQVETVREQVVRNLLSVPHVALSLAAASGGLLTLAAAALPLVLIPLGGALICLVLLMRTAIPRQRAVLLANEQLAAHTGHLIDSVRDITACGAQDKALAEAAHDIHAQARTTRALARVGAMRSVAITIGAQLPLILVLATVASHAALSTGALLGTITYLTGSIEPATRSLVKTVGGSGLLLVSALHRLAETSAPATETPTEPKRPPTGAQLQLRQVTFAYSTHAEPVLRKLDLTIEAGSHLAIVGPSGIGKSTLANLLVGLINPQHGEIRLGGIPLPNITARVRHQLLALIPQESYVFTGSLRDNLTYLHPGATPDALEQAVRTFRLQALRDRIGGDDATVAPETLSAGESQLIALARTYLSPAHIVVLDEATCHLDPTAEADAENAFTQRRGTLIVIAHRLSSARRADQILLLNGTDPTLGTHDELLNTSPLYADLAHHWNDTPTPASHDAI